jgi:hypothetical protein
LGSKTPKKRCSELVEAVPLQEEVEAGYDLKRERAKMRDFCRPTVSRIERMSVIFTSHYRMP